MEVQFATETVDGIAASHTFRKGKWGLEVNPFFGGWDTIVHHPDGSRVRARTFNAVGGSAWVLTPMEGVRVGGAAFRSSTDSQDAGDDTTWRLMADASFARVAVRAEYFENSDDDTDWVGYYALVTVRPSDKVALNLQYTRSWLDFTSGFFSGTRFNIERDLAASINYSFRPNIVFKLEGHEGKGQNVFADRTPDARYAIASVSASF
jgi:hypothetical protein